MIVSSIFSIESLFKKKRPKTLNVISSLTPIKKIEYTICILFHSIYNPRQYMDIYTQIYIFSNIFVAKILHVSCRKFYMSRLGAIRNKDDLIEKVTDFSTEASFEINSMLGPIKKKNLNFISIPYKFVEDSNANIIFRTMENELKSKILQVYTCLCLFTLGAIS